MTCLPVRPFTQADIAKPIMLWEHICKSGCNKTTELQRHLALFTEGPNALKARGFGTPSLSSVNALKYC